MGLIWIICSTRIDKDYFRRVWIKWRLENSILKVMKSEMRLKEAREERIWIERNPNINLINYPYYKLNRMIQKKE